MSPVLPTCAHCGEEVEITHRCDGGNVIVLNGTCGSGKSTIAEILLRKGFLVIDGDCVIQVVKHKKGTTQWDFNEIAAETAIEIDILSMFGDDFVLSTVILPEDLDKYIEIFQVTQLEIPAFPPQAGVSDRCGTLPVKDLPRERYARILDKTLL